MDCVISSRFERHMPYPEQLLQELGLPVPDSELLDVARSLVSGAVRGLGRPGQC